LVVRLVVREAGPVAAGPTSKCRRPVGRN